jgi:rod shape-determining protein MreD
MELTKKQRTIKYLVYCLLIAFAALLQNTDLWFEIGGAHCFFIIPVTVLLGINEDERVSALLGLFAGFLWDTVSAQHMGFNFVYLSLVCYISSALVSYVFRDTFWVAVINAILCTVVYCIIYWFVFVFIKDSHGATVSLGCFYIPSAVYTSVMAVVLALILNPLKRKLNKEYKTD